MFYMVFVPSSGRGSTVIHPTFKLAEEEAIRIARKDKVKVVIMGSVCRIVEEKPLPPVNYKWHLDSSQFKPTDSNL